METLQKKEFTQRDVQRLRNLYSKNFGAVTTIQTGYTAKKEERKEGETWEEGEKQWIIKNGIKQSYSKLQRIRKELSTPFVCPDCKARMKTDLDKKMYVIHKKCFSCVQSMETKLKVEGKYDEYVKGITNLNAKSFIKDARALAVNIQSNATEYFTAEGQKEDWVGGASTQDISDKLNKELDELEEKIK